LNILINDDNNIINNEIIKYLYKATDIILDLNNIPNENIEISLTLADEEEIKRINKEFRGIDKITDVLSFPQFDNYEYIIDEISDIIAIGDVVICNSIAKSQALEYGHSYEREFVYLFVHSILHLLGYDHMNEDDKEIMRSKEELVMSKMGMLR